MILSVMIKKILTQITPPLLASLIKLVLNYRSLKDTKISEFDTLRALPRKVKFESYILGQKIIGVDASSLLQVYESFFKQEYCKFITKLEIPRIIDCGANIGATVYYWKKLYPDAEIIAFEPDPEIFEVLRENCKDFLSTTIIQSGLWTFEGEIQFLANGTDGGHLAEFTDNETEDKTKISIPVKRLRDYLLQPCSMLKIDIEGAEIDVLIDCFDLLYNVENMFIEYHSFVNKNQRLGEFFTLLENAGFRIHVLDESTAQQPFVSRPIYNSKDLRLDVFAFRDKVFT